MRLTIENGQKILSDQVQAYLRGTVTYDELRFQCFTIGEVHPVIEPVLTIVDTMSSMEKVQTTERLTTLAHEQQINTDAIEEACDREKAVRYRGEKDELNTKISQLKSELFVVNGYYLFDQYRYTTVRNNLQKAQSSVHALEYRQRNESHQHSHPNEHHHAHQHSHSFYQTLHPLEMAKAHVASLQNEERNELSTYMKRLAEKDKYKREISSCESSIHQCVTGLKELQQKEETRNHRRINKVLSSANALLLQKNIQIEHGFINSTCDQVKNWVKTHCYPIFLNQLKGCLETLLLSQNEKVALAQIIIEMNEHQRDITVKQQQEGLLSQVSMSLQLQKQSYARKQSECETLNKRNVALANANEMLHSNLLRLEASHKKLLEQRNRYAKYSLAAVGMTAIGSITAYFLITSGVIALVPGANIILAAGAGIAILGLILTCGIAAARACSKQVERDAHAQSLLRNNSEIDQNNQSINNLQQKDIPGLIDSIAKLEQEVMAQRLQTEDACKKASASLAHANAINVDMPFGVDHNHHGFFASAPPAEIFSNSQATYNSQPLR